MNVHSYLIERFIIAKKKNTDKYQRILDAAIKVFAEQGFFQSTIAQIAKAAGVADGTIYLYFKNKDDILVQFYQYKTRQIFERFRDVVNRSKTAEEKLRCLIRVHLQEFQKDRNMAIVYQAETHQYYRRNDENLKEMSKMYRDIISEVVELGQEEGAIRKDLYMGLVKRFINGAVDEVINSWIHAGGQYDLVTMADPLVDLFISGIGGCRNTGSTGDHPTG
ncbi:TetR/AcrR family transcriptional regulator [Desulfosarcina ovata]|uniref:Fatty acid metabolism regulator protein n=1 Tax=Desulfosarcina ovata subsp. ovata TaxID=2752305 RepID=A0A5K8AIQ7_9BACT|nr:TetR/AcrR family transcriptional regulator [Desulfosarcina ovata]BBO92376.1 fatty acid metabolism regulator protein [Desulfosarcina ovata subsp. ovata]